MPLPMKLRCAGQLAARGRAPARAAAAIGVCAALIAAHGCGGTSQEAPEVLGAEAATRLAAENPVTVSPLPGTRDASPSTQISFLGVARTRIEDVRVRGSESGAHAGALREYSTGTGASFLPGRAFQPGEHIVVSARASTPAGTRIARTSFTVAAPAQVSRAEFAREGGDPSAVQHFLSAPGLSPSSVAITTPAQPGSSPGYLFLAPYQGRGTPGPMIADQDGRLVWFHPLAPGIEAANFGVQRYRGEPVLAWWQGRILRLGFGEGEDVIYDRSYRRVATVSAGNGLRTDLHVLRLTPQGTAWIDAFYPIHADLSAVHGASDGELSDSVIQEIDVATGLVMWEWHALGHVPAGESRTPPAPGSYPWDYVHVNSLDPGPEGDVLLSARNTWALYDVDLHSGAVRWRLGGRRSSYALAPRARFYWQHDGEFQAGGMVSLFDNGSDPPEEAQSRALLLKPDALTRSARVVREFVNPTRTLRSASQGNVARLTHDNWLIGYGGLPSFTEFDRAGRLLLDGTLGAGVQDFATFIAAWRGAPAGEPSLSVRAASGGEALLAASWNGATGVSAWRVLEGAAQRHLAAVARVPRQGFESTLTLPARGRYFAVQALAASGRVLGTSAAVRAGA